MIFLIFLAAKFEFFYSFFKGKLGKSSNLQD